MSSTFLQTLAADFKAVENFFTSGVGLEITDLAATAAGAGSALAIIEEANPSNKTGTANDVFALASAAYTLLSGSTPPTQAQVEAVFTSFKSDSATAAYSSLATQLASTFSAFLQKYTGANWVQIATAYVYGWQIVGQMLSGSTAVAATTTAA